MEVTEKSESSYYSSYVVAMEKVVDYHILTKYSKCNTFQVISDLVHDYMNFKALKIICQLTLWDHWVASPKPQGPEACCYF